MPFWTLRDLQLIALYAYACLTDSQFPQRVRGCYTGRFNYTRTMPPRSRLAGWT